ncbi:MAG: bifunctional oligoribonuclease/PAP phosphatase NrnA [Desulfobacterales bacterium]|nr:bifunctional oligoribonuclease/PAP phosphatase NrnA [Desulfobacterales bacterium]
MMDQIIHQLKNSRHVLLATHTNPDGDAIGSLLAMGLALNALGISTTVFNEEPIPAVYRYLSGIESISHNIAAPSQYDTALILDCGDLKRVGKTADVIRMIPVVINVDHHPTNARFGEMQIIDPSACATAEIVYYLIKALGAPLNKAIATCIYTGIITDTGSFRFQNTNRAAFHICDEMVGQGVDPYLIAQYVYGTYSLGRLKLINLALDSIEISENGKLSLMVVTREMLQTSGTHPCDADGLITYARSIENVQVAVLIQEQSDNSSRRRDKTTFHVSLRANGAVDVSAIAGAFGGGGHYSAAGFSIESSLTDLKAKIFGLATNLEHWRPKEGEVCELFQPATKPPIRLSATNNRPKTTMGGAGLLHIRR